MILHLLAAVLAGLLTGTDPVVLLAIANHESRFTESHVTAEPGNRVSCGVMTPYPRAACHRTSLLAQYVDGARHLRTWLDVPPCRQLPTTLRARCALLGYAGGYWAISKCSKSRAGRVCSFPELIARGGV